MTNNGKAVRKRTFLHINPLESKAFCLSSAFFAVPLITYFVMSGAFFRHIPAFLVVALAVIAFLAVKCVKNKKNIRGTATALTLIVLAFISSVYCYNTGYRAAYALAEDVRDEKHMFSGYMLEDSDTSGSMFVEIIAVDGRTLKIPVKAQGFNYTGFSMNMGAYIEFEGKIRLAEEKESEFNEWLSSKGVHTSIYSMKNTVLDGTKDKSSFVSDMKHFLQKSLYSVLSFIPENDRLDRTYSVSNAMMLGDKSELDDELKDMFTKSGIIHVLCVSGLHFSVMLGGLSFVIKNIVSNRRLKNVILFSAALLYLFICGFTRSALRAAVMAFVAAFGISEFRQRYCTHVLLLAVSIICIADPDSIFDGGFRMSCICCVGILSASLITEAVSRRFVYRPVVCCLLSSLIVSLSASSFLLPYSLTAFGGVSSVSVIASSIAVLPVQVFLIICWICTLLSFIMPDIVRFAAASILSLMSEFICGVAELFSDLKYSYIQFDVPDYSFFVFMLFIGFAAIVSDSKSRAASFYICYVGFSAAATAVFLVMSAVGM